MNVKVNDTRSYQIEIEDGKIRYGQEIVEIDYHDVKSGHTHFIFQNRSYSAEIVSENRVEKTALIKVNGNLYSVAIEDQYDALLKQMGLDSLQGNKVQEIKAPMPGLVLKVLVEQGAVVVKGDSLLILEAMKMENMIKSPTDGTVKKVMVHTGDKVEKNQILIQFD